MAITVGTMFTVSSQAVVDNWRQPVNDWEAASNQGVLYIQGSLTQGSCLLSMDSAYQAIDMGNTVTADLKKVGDTGRPVEFSIELLDCLQALTTLTNNRTDTVTWSNQQPGVKIRFLSATSAMNPDIIQVNGAKGLGLQLITAHGQVLSIGENTPPQLLNLNSNKLSYFVRPIRTAAPLVPGAYHAIITFELIYD
ncbi:fimbrial protein [Utexia brackfieldae]|uniref:fimbrial protein n=1 Tax=Utexia brackfieldae TaxID=3074108 RepID=UPI00370D5806